MNLSKTIISTSKDLGGSAYDLASSIGSSAADLAKSLGSGTADLAKQVGWKRGLIGLAAIAGVTAGAIVLVRYLKARADEAPIEGAEAGNDKPNFVPKHKKHKPFIAHH